jgi:hypothetical protein
LVVLLILVYHMSGAGQDLGVYMLNRVLATSYLFVDGFQQLRDHWQRKAEASAADEALQTVSVSVYPNQGDQIGRIFAQWVIVFFGQFYKNYRSSPKFHIGRLFFTYTYRYYVVILTKKMVWQHFGRFFYKLLWSASSQLL